MTVSRITTKNKQTTTTFSRLSFRESFHRPPFQILGPLYCCRSGEPEATEQGSNSNRHRNICMGPYECFLAKCKGLWSRKDQGNKALWLILWAPQCNALLCFSTACFSSFGHSKGVLSVVLNASDFEERFYFVYIF